MGHQRIQLSCQLPGSLRSLLVLGKLLTCLQSSRFDCVPHNFPLLVVVDYKQWKNKVSKTALPLV